MTISLNVLPQPAIDTAALLDWVAAAKPPKVVNPNFEPEAKAGAA